MAELADALDSGSNGRKAVQVQVLLPAPTFNLVDWLIKLICEVLLYHKLIHSLSLLA